MMRCAHTRLGAIKARKPAVRTRMMRLTMDQSCMSRLDRSWICLWISSARASMDGCSCLTSDINSPFAVDTRLLSVLDKGVIDFPQEVREKPLRLITLVSD